MDRLSRPTLIVIAAACARAAGGIGRRLAGPISALSSPSW
jgi:hypothetical protein